MLIKSTISFGLFFCFYTLLIGQNTVVGKWQTIDDKTEKSKSIIELYKKEGKLYGKVVSLYLTPEEDQDPLCDLCSDYRKNQKIIGMEILSDMKWNEQEKEWEDGEILDPENGTIYDCKVWLEKGKLKVRGYVAFFYRTQTWNRVR